MSEPAVEDGGEGEGPTPDSPDDEREDEDVEVVQTDIEETGADPEGFFDDVDEGSGTSGDDIGDIFDGVDDEDESGGEAPEAAPTRSSGLSDDINSGVARAAVIGLDEEWQTPSGDTRTKDDLETEFRETFEAFRLGHYGSIVAEEYLLEDADDIHPVWGLLGAAIISAAVIVYRRPDGDQVIDSAKTKLGEHDFSNLADRLPSPGEEDDS